MQPIPGHDGYFATAGGEIVSSRSGEPRQLVSRISEGYRMVTMTVGRMRHRLPVHRLVTMAFHGLPSDHKQEARHLNGQSLDNAASNLAWGTGADNAADAIRHGTLGPGMRARRRKLDDTQVAAIRRRHLGGEVTKQIAIEFGIHPSYVLMLAKGKRWPSAGTGAVQSVAVCGV